MPWPLRLDLSLVTVTQSQWPPGGRPTCVAPHGQVLVLLDVQHDLQAVTRPALHGGAQRLALLGRVEHVALAVPGEHLEGETVRNRQEVNKGSRVGFRNVGFQNICFLKMLNLFCVMTVVIFCSFKLLCFDL